MEPVFFPALRAGAFCRACGRRAFLFSLVAIFAGCAVETPHRDAGRGRCGAAMRPGYLSGLSELCRKYDGICARHAPLWHISAGKCVGELYRDGVLLCGMVALPGPKLGMALGLVIRNCVVCRDADLLQSRAGIIGALLYTLFILAIRFRARQKGMFTLLVAVVSLSLLALHIIKFYGSGSAFLQHFGSVEKGHSTLERWIMIKTSWKMIVAHPFSGWGYGSFEYIASRFSLANYQHLLNADHPHNEVLFEWAEGGLLALAGLITIVVGAMWMLRRAPRSGIALWGVMLPIVFHMMVEYPLLQSVPHWFTLLLLCRLAVCRRAFTLPKRSLKISWLMPATAAAGLIFMLTGFKTGSVLTAFERGGMQDFTAASAVINPWIQWDRWQYDEHSALLIRYNQTRDPALLERYSQWAMCYLERRNDLQVFENIARINKFDPRTERTQWLNRQWREYYVTLAGALQQNNRHLQQ